MCSINIEGFSNTKSDVGITRNMPKTNATLCACKRHIATMTGSSEGKGNEDGNKETTKEIWEFDIFMR